MGLATHRRWSDLVVAKNLLGGEFSREDYGTSAPQAGGKQNSLPGRHLDLFLMAALLWAWCPST